MLVVALAALVGIAYGGSLVFFIKSTSSFMRALPLQPNHSPKALPSDTITIDSRFQHVNLGEEGINTQSVAQSLSFS